MLVLSRKPNQEIHVPQYGIKFRVLGVEGKRVRIGIDAPDDVRIIRKELAFDTDEESSTKSGPADCLDPGYVWPLGVQFVPGRSSRPNKNRIRDKFPNHFEEADSGDVPRLAPSLSH